MNANDVADAILARVDSPLTAMELQKLLYYTQAWHLAITDEPLFQEPVEAWVDGPVVDAVWRQRKAPQSRRPTARTEVQVTDTVDAIIQLVCAQYGHLSGDELSTLSHEEGPWLKARAGLAAGARARRVIDQREMARFYRGERTLCGRRAEDLAAAGVFIRDQRADDTHLDIDALLAEIEADAEMPSQDGVFAANLASYPNLSMNGIRTRPRGPRG